MGKVTLNPSFESFKGKLGNIVFSKLGDINIYRRKAENPANPRTQAQTANRNALKETTAFLRPFLPAIKAGFHHTAIKGRKNALTEWAAAVRANLAILKQAGELDADNVLIADGTQTLTPTISSGRGSTVDVSWNAPEQNSALADAKAYVFALNPLSGRTSLDAVPASAQALTTDLSLVADADQQDSVALFFFLASDDAASKSVRIR